MTVEGFCPECKTMQKSSSVVQRSTTPKPFFPWSYVLKTHRCDHCMIDIPAHLWMLKEISQEAAVKEWQEEYRHRLDLVTYARTTNSKSLLEEIVDRYDHNIEIGVLPEEQVVFNRFKMQALIALKRKPEAKEIALRNVVLDSSVSLDLIVSYICLCLDTNSIEDALFGLRTWSEQLRGARLQFLKYKIQVAIEKKHLKTEQIREFDYLNVNYCPICNVKLPFMPRYPKYICKSCRTLVSDINGKQVRYVSDSKGENPIFDSGKIKSFYLKDNVPYNSDYCWVDGVKCKASVSRFGGVVVQTCRPTFFKNKKNKILVLRNDVIVDELDLEETLGRYKGILKNGVNKVEALLKLLNAKSSYNVYRLRYENIEEDKKNSSLNPDSHKDKESETNKINLKEVQHILFVDEEGNPVSPEDIKPGLTTFTDEYGRNVDFRGNFVIAEDNDILQYSEDEILNFGHRMLEKNDFSELVQHCRICLSNSLYQNSPRLWSLAGFGNINLGRLQEAHKCFLTSLYLNQPNVDSIVLVNFVTVCFNLNKKDSALEAIEKYFELLDDQGMQFVFDSIKEAVRTRLLGHKDFERLSKTIPIFKKVGK